LTTIPWLVILKNKYRHPSKPEQEVEGTSEDGCKEKLDDSAGMDGDGVGCAFAAVEERA